MNSGADIRGKIGHGQRFLILASPGTVFALPKEQTTATVWHDIRLCDASDPCADRRNR